MSFFKTLVFYVTDLLRGEVLNVGLAMVCPETGFTAAKFLPSEEVAKLEFVLFGKSSLVCDAQYLDSWVEVLKTHKEPLEREDPFTAIYGRSHYMSCFQWRPAASGILLNRTPEQVFAKLFTDYVERKVQQ